MTDLRLAGELVGSMDRLSNLLSPGSRSTVEHNQKKDRFDCRVAAVDGNGKAIDGEEKQTMISVDAVAAPHLVETINRLVDDAARLKEATDLAAASRSVGSTDVVGDRSPSRVIAPGSKPNGGQPTSPSRPASS